MKLGIIGAGSVGAACLLATVMRGAAHEIILINRDRKRADGVVADVQYGAALSSAVELRAGDYPDLEGASLVMITAGVNEKGGGATDRSDPDGRLRLLQTNAEVYREMIPQIRRAAPDALVLVVTDPPDPLADVVRMFGHERVLSTGTYLDSLRFRFHLARHFKVDPASVEALVVGEHGTSEVLLWSSARIGGRPVLDLLADNEQAREAIRRKIEHEVRYANIAIIEGIGASQYGIGMVCARIAEIMQRNARAVIPIGCFSGKFGVTLSLPSVVGREGVVRALEPEMSDAERQALERSAGAIKKALSRIEFGAPAPKAA
jgi:L-lactate dehydrogenase